MRTILVTGGRGFVGSHVTARAQDRGLRVVQPVGDLREPAAMTAAVDADPDAECVVHLAAPPRSGLAPWKLVEDELRMAGNVLAAAGGRPVLFAGSAAQYGMGAAEALTEEAPTEPLTAYAASKCVVERAVLAAPLAGSGRAIWARTFNIAGPGQPTGAPVASWADQLAGGERLLRTGNLDVTRDILDVRDVADAYLDLLASDFAGVVNVGSGAPVEMRSVAQELVDLAGGDARLDVDPALVRDSDPPHVVADVGRLRAAVGFEPRYAVGQTLRDVLDDRRKHAGAGSGR